MKILKSDQWRRWPPCGQLIGVLILLNIWYDYYHPLGFMFDIILVIVLLVKYLNRSTPT